MSRTVLDVVQPHEVLTTPREHAPASLTLIEQLLPDYDYHQTFSTLVPTARHAVFAALSQLRFSDLTLLRMLAIRTPGRSERESPDEPILAGAKLAPYVLTEEIQDQETMIALMGRFWTQNAFAPIVDRADFAKPPSDYARTAWSVRLEDARGGTRVTAETRVKDPSDPAAAGKFRPYLHLMGQIGSAAFSLSMLTALKRRLRSGASVPIDPALACATDMTCTRATLALAASVGAVIVFLRIASKRRAGFW